MGYWEGKCFFCYWYAALAAIVALSVKPIYNDIKNNKSKKKNQVRDTSSSQNGVFDMSGNKDKTVFFRNTNSNHPQI